MQEKISQNNFPKPSSKDKIPENNYSQVEKAIPLEDKCLKNFYLRSDPYYDSNIFSRLFCIYGFKIVRAFRNKQYSSTNLGILKKNNKSHNYSKKIINCWKKSKNKNIIKLIIKSNFCILFIIFICNFIQAYLDVYTVNLFKSLIENYTDENTKNEYTNAYIYFAVQFILIFFKRKLNEYQTHVGYRIGYQLDCLIFNKMMNSKSLQKSKSKKKDHVITTADVINYIEIDSYKLTSCIILIPNFVTLPFSLGLYFKMLWEFFGMPLLYGLIVFFIFIIINFLFLRSYQYHQTMEQKGKDETIKNILATFKDIVNVKLNAEEIDNIKNIYAKKNEELTFYSNKRLANNYNQSIIWFAPIAMTVTTIFVYQYIYQGSNIDVEDIYTCLNIFIKINEPIRNIPLTLQTIYETYVSLKRIRNFLETSENNDDVFNYVKNDPDSINKNIAVQINKGTFTWGKEKKQKGIVKEEKEINDKIKTKIIKELSDPLIPEDNNHSINNYTEKKLENGKSNINEIDNDNLSSTKKIVLSNINLTIYKGELVAIYGKSGSGKSSLLEAILNEMQIVTSPNDQFKVITKINGTTSYTAQSPFIYNSTIRQNIAFNLSEEVELNCDRYFDIIDICSLRNDLSELKGGDLTEIGFNGINLSQGQIRRICNARGLYADKDIYLFDQPTYNLNYHVGWKILYNGIYKYLKGKTRIVVTNNVNFAQFADKIIILKEGKIVFCGKFNDLIENESNNEGFDFKNINNEKLSKISYKTNLNYILANNNKNKNKKNLNNNNNNLISYDSSSQNSSQKSLIYKITKNENESNFTYNGSVFSAPVPYLEGKKLVILTFFIIFEWQLTISGSDLWMVYWNSNHGKGLKKNWRYLIVYASLGLLGSLCVYFRNRLTTKSTNIFCKNLNFHMIYHLVNARINTFYTQTSLGQMINRLSYDLNNIEDNFYKCWVNVVSTGTSLLVGMLICIYFMWSSVFLLPIVNLIVILLTIYYTKSQRELYRLECSIRAPLINYLNEISYGKSTIKAFNLVDHFINEFHEKLDMLFKSRMWINISYQWFGFIIRIFTFSLDFFLIFEAIHGHLKNYYNIKPEVYALLLNYLFSFEESLDSFQMNITELESVMVSFERSIEYNTIPSENYARNLIINSFDDNFKFKNGKIEFQNYSLKYRKEGKLVLNDINCIIKGGEKIAIVGRTGAGKSSLIYALSRIIESCNGRILIDDIDIKTIPLKILRKNIGFLSQDVHISEGTLLSNIDPMQKYSDDEVKDALKKLNYWFSKEEPDYGLYDHIEENGENLTLSEKYLLSVTKLLLQKNKSILILDDFSSNLDKEIEETVFNAIYSTFPKCTIINITNSIKPGMKIEKVMVINNGILVEFDKFDKLDKDKNSFYSKLQIMMIEKEDNNIN